MLICARYSGVEFKEYLSLLESVEQNVDNLRHSKPTLLPRGIFMRSTESLVSLNPD